MASGMMYVNMTYKLLRNYANLLYAQHFADSKFEKNITYIVIRE
jgi:hypothetical protein